MLDFIAKTPVVRFLASDLTEGLELLPLIRRQAVLFGLEQGMTECDEVIALTHDRAKTLQLTELARALVDAQPRHIRIPYVFWDTMGALQCPLIGLEDDVRSVFGGMAWADLVHAYKHMAWVHPEIEAARFMEAARAHGLMLP